jgi:raffinose/stachyose/melibiose transport system substrate-binding protein
MKTRWVWYVLLVGALTALAATNAFAGGGGEKGPEISGSPVHLVFWSIIGGDTSVPQDQWYLEQSVARFEKAHPNIKIEIVHQSDENIVPLYRAASIAKNGPDLSTLWVGGQVNANAEFFLPLNKYFAKELPNYIGTETAWRDYKVGTDLLAVPFCVTVTGSFYNKAHFRRAGLPENAEFKDMNEFYAAASKLKAAGFLPIVMGEKEGWTGSWFANNLVVQKFGPTFVSDIVSGKISYTDQGFIDAYTAYHQIYEKGLCNDDVITLSYNDADSKFSREEASMVAQGSWAIGTFLEALGKDLGYMRVPPVSQADKYVKTMIGGPAYAFLVSNYSQHPDEAVLFIKHEMTQEEQKAEFDQIGDLPNLKDFDYSKVTLSPIHQAIAEKWLKEGAIAGYIDDLSPIEVQNEWYRMNPLVLSGRISVAEHAKILDMKQKGQSK